MWETFIIYFSLPLPLLCCLQSVVSQIQEREYISGRRLVSKPGTFSHWLKDLTWLACSGTILWLWATALWNVVAWPLSYVTPWTIAHQAPLFMGFPRQEYWSGLPFPSPGESSWPRDGTCIDRWILYSWATRETPWNVSHMKIRQTALSC